MTNKVILCYLYNWTILATLFTYTCREEIKMSIYYFVFCKAFCLFFQTTKAPVIRIRPLTTIVQPPKSERLSLAAVRIVV